MPSHARRAVRGPPAELPRRSSGGRRRRLPPLHRGRRPDHRGWTDRPRGRGAGDASRPAGGPARRRLFGPHRHAGFHRSAYPLSPDADNRGLRGAAARLARRPCVVGRAAVRRSGPCRRGGGLLPRRASAQRNHDGCRLLHRPSAVRRGAVRRGARAQRAHGRRQGADGPRRAGGAAGYRPARLRRERGADRRVAWAGPAALRRDAALRGHLDRGPTRGRRRAGPRAPRRLPPVPSRREPARDRDRQGAISLGGPLYRRLRPPRAARAALVVRPLHPPRRGRAVAAQRKRLRRRVLSDLEPVPGQRPLRLGTGRGMRAFPCAPPSPPTWAAAPAIRCCARRPRRSKWRSFAASDWRRWRPSTGSLSATRGRSAWMAISAAWSPAATPTSSSSTPVPRRPWRTAWRPATATSPTSCSC